MGMLQSNIDKLERHRVHYTRWVHEQNHNVGGAEKGEIMEVIRAEFNPTYNTDLWCGACVGAMIKYAFEEMDRRVEAMKADAAAKKKSDTVKVNLKK